MQSKPRLTPRDWKHIGIQTLTFTAAGIIVSLIGSHILLSTFSNGLNTTGIMAAVLIPLVLAGPTTFYLSRQNAQLRDAYRRLEAAAARDSLTRCLNHGAFVTQANAFLHRTNPEDAKGALLVVDADFFKSVNDRFGHHIGDTALRQIAARIQSVVRNGDLVGRLGGEEFGILLPGADRQTAQTIAERIRESVQTIEFEVEGNCFSLSVSVGGAVFEHAVDYGELFRSADKRLYRVKNSGRNNVDLMHFAAAAGNDTGLRRAG